MFGLLYIEILRLTSREFVYAYAVPAVWLGQFHGYLHRKAIVNVFVPPGCLLVNLAISLHQYSANVFSHLAIDIAVPSPLVAYKDVWTWKSLVDKTQQKHNIQFNVLCLLWTSNSSLLLQSTFYFIFTNVFLNCNTIY